VLHSAQVNIVTDLATRPSESPKSVATLRPGSLTKDESEFQRLLETHLPRVRSIVERIRRRLPSSIEADDLYSIGVTGLVAAARNYKPAQERSFGSYANTRIQGAI
jgi:RNA polymerase sigma factor FliA